MRLNNKYTAKNQLKQQGAKRQIFITWKFLAKIESTEYYLAVAGYWTSLRGYILVLVLNLI